MVKHQDHATAPSEEAKPAIGASGGDGSKSGDEQPMLEAHGSWFALAHLSLQC
jgi:hypothetical protein